MDYLHSVAFRDWVAQFLVVLFLVGGFAVLAAGLITLSRTLPTIIGSAREGL